VPASLEDIDANDGVLARQRCSSVRASFPNASLPHGAMGSKNWCDLTKAALGTEQGAPLSHVDVSRTLCCERETL
jgi:hypothetical protein